MIMTYNCNSIIWSPYTALAFHFEVLYPRGRPSDMSLKLSEAIDSLDNKKPTI